MQRHRGVGGTECSGERGEGEVKDRGSDHEEEAEEEGRKGGGRERSALARWFPTKQVRLHISSDCKKNTSEYSLF